MANEKLIVQMFGSFGLNYAGKAISFERNNATKTNQLLQLLLLAGENGISRTQLLNTLFGREEITNPATSLRTTVFRLRKLLAKELPESDYVNIKTGVYYWTSDIEASLDVDAFEAKANAALKAEEADRRRLLREACECYRGEFLPELSDQEWVVIRQAQYRKLYFKCLEELKDILVEENRFDVLLPFVRNAATWYPYDEWQAYVIDCLIAMGKDKEAMEVYQETAELYFSELGTEPSERMKERFRRMSGDGENKQIHGIQHAMEEEEEIGGAYYCSYPSFAETYRYIKRVIERSGQSAYLLQVTITDGKGVPLEREERLAKVGEELRTSIQSALRRGDLFTQYRANIFLMLLMEIKQEDLECVINRINSKFEMASRKNYLSYSFAPLCDVETADETMHFSKLDTIWE